MVERIFLKLMGGTSSVVLTRRSLTPKMVQHRNSGERMHTTSAMHPKATLALPPMVRLPVVNMGMSTEAAVPPMPANSVAREVNWLRSSASELRAATMPQ